MIKKGSELIGLPIICLKEGYKKIEVKDLLYCNENKKIVAIVVDEGGYFHDCKVILFDYIMNIGDNGITIENQNFIEKSSQVKNEAHLNNTRQKLLDVEVFTEKGQSIGTVQDIIIDTETGKLLGLILKEGLFYDLVEGRPILPLTASISLNKEMIIIPNVQEQSIIHNTGGLKRLFSLE